MIDRGTVGRAGGAVTAGGAVVAGAGVVVAVGGSGAVSVSCAPVTVRLPPVAVAGAASCCVSSEIAIAAAVPRIATTRPSSAGRIQPLDQGCRSARPAEARSSVDELLVGEPEAALDAVLLQRLDRRRAARAERPLLLEGAHSSPPSATDAAAGAAAGRPQFAQ